MTVDFDLPAERPAGLRRPRAVDVALTSVDTTDPHRWTWDGFPHPYRRFDTLSGSFRVRYAGWTHGLHCANDSPSGVSPR